MCYIKLKFYAILIVFLINLLFVAVNGYENLCTTKDKSKRCDCYYVTYHFMVNCGWKNLEILPESKVLPKQFNSLDLSYNRIKKLSFDESDFDPQPFLYLLKASHNEIYEVSDEFLRNVPELTHLDLSYNKIRNLDNALFGDNRMQKLKYLDLSYNSIKLIPEKLLIPLKRLEFLDLSYNEELGKQIGEYKYKRFCDFIGNDKENFTTLKLNSIALSNPLPQGFFNCNASKLEHLSLADNNLEKVPANLPQTIKVLNLSGNRFVSLNARQLKFDNIRKLYLSRLKQLSQIENYAFFDLLDTLEELYIDNNPKLVNLNELAFGLDLDEEKWALNKLSLSGNAINVFNSSYFFLFKRISQIDISHNPFFCTCDVKWFPLLKSHFINKHFMKCVMPAKLRNKNIFDLGDKEQPKCNLERYWRSQKVLTIIITFLILILFGLIMYLIYLGPFKKGQIYDERFPGQYSPYGNAERIVLRDES